MNLERVRTVADAVLYEGYLLYPYRASSSKNHSRWQWGVLGPPGASAASLGEEPTMSTQCLLGSAGAGAQVRVLLRFLQLQTRGVEQADHAESTGFVPVPELQIGSSAWTSWDEAVPHEIELGPCPVSALQDACTMAVEVDGGEDVELLHDEHSQIVGRTVRRRWPLSASVRVSATSRDDVIQLSVTVDNDAQSAPGTKEEAIRASFIGAHLLLVAEGASFISLLEPPDAASAAAAECRQHRCWPVLAGEPGDTQVVLASPIILYDYPEVAEQSAGALFDSTEIDEILTLRVMTLTDEEKAAARATDPRAAEIIDRCEQMSPDSMQALHGILRDPHAAVAEPSAFDLAGSHTLPDMDEVPTFTEAPTYTDARNLDPASFDTGGAPWWDPAADASASPETDTVLVDGVRIARDSIVRLRPSRRADAQDLFFADQVARVTAVLGDVDGQVHVAVVLVDDPAAEMHEWYGRYLYFAPEELEPLDSQFLEAPTDHREESRP